MRVTHPGTDPVHRADRCAGIEHLDHQNQISSGSPSRPRAGPGAAGRVDNYNQVLAQSQQYSANANAAQSGLNTKHGARAVTSQLQSLRDLALEANSGTESSQIWLRSPRRRSRSSRACCRSPTPGRQRNYIFAVSMHDAAVRPDGNGRELLRRSRPAPVQIARADGCGGRQRRCRVQPDQERQRHVLRRRQFGEHRLGIIGHHVSDPASYPGDSYSIQFTAADTYQVTDTTTNAVVTAAPTPPASDRVRRLQVTLSGQPATAIPSRESEHQSKHVHHVQNLVTALQAAPVPRRQTR